MIITISGFPGSGKSTVGKLLAEKLDYKYISVGDLRGKIAIEHDMTIDELNKIGEKESWTDDEVDQKLRNIGKEEDNYVVDARLGYYFIPNSIKVFLDVDLKTGAKRIFKGEKRPDEKSFSSIKELKQELKKRIKSDKKRYKKWYDIDFTDKSQYDLIIDTNGLNPKEIVEKILEYIKKHKQNL